MTLTGVINDRYDIERELGRGGMATVYLARDIRHGNRVALKVLSADLASMVSGERFIREIRITAGLQHPHILPVFDSGQVNGLPYYVMPFVDGPTVEQRIKAEGALPIAEALEIACEVADALAHAHSQGFVHRDIKPSNILLAHGHAVVADFGIARALEPVVSDQELTRTGIAVGTAAYMSPEQSAGEDVDGRADVYSLGCVLYEMLAGKPPFAATSPRALMAKHWMNEVPSLSALRRSVRRSIEALVLRALAKRADQRFATAAEFEEAIQRVSTEEKLVAAGFTPSEDQPAFDPAQPVTSSNPEMSRVTDAMSLEETAPSAGSPTVSGETSSSAPLAMPVERDARRVGIRNVAIAALAVTVAAFTVWKVTQPAEVVLDRNRVIVYPLLVPSDFTGSRNLGEDIGTMIGTALDGAGDLRWIDGWPLLSPEIRQDARNLTSENARALARERRAAWYLTGRVVVRGDSAEVFLELNDVDGDSTVARGHAVGRTTDAWRTGLHAVNTLLPALIQPGTAGVDILAEWKDRNPTAVASFLLAESEFRRAHLVEALEQYRAALRTDSSFALAAIRGAQAATWNHRSDEASSFIDLALRQRLPARYMHFARAYKSYIAGGADSAAAEFRRVLVLDPEMAAAWMQLGEVYMHLLPLEGNLDSLARIALDEAYRLDPSGKQVLYHLIELRLRAGDPEGAAPMMREFLAARPDSQLSQQVSLMYDCVARGRGAVQWAEVVRTSPLAALSAANSLKGGGVRLDCASDGYAEIVRADTSQAGSGRRWAATFGLSSALLVRKRFDEARAQIDSSIARGTGGSSFYLMAGLLYEPLRSLGAEVASADVARYSGDYAAAPSVIRLWQLGVWHALSGQPEVAAAIARALGTRSGETSASAELRLSRSINAFVVLARGDSTRALGMLRSLVTEPVPGGDIAWDVAAPRGFERLTLARLLFARKDFQNAISVANVFDAAWPSVYLLYLPASLELRAEAAAALSEDKLAAQLRSRLSALRGERGTAGK
ncbi:MAG: protein kinase domain-containing protein [Gemmatimonadaceae bacterium]